MSSSSSSSSASAPPSPSLPHEFFEDELLSDLEKDDDAILEKRFNIHTNIRRLQNKVSRRTFQRIMKTQTQWTRAFDFVQEHFSSHVTLDGVSYRLPPKLYALKLAAKHSWILYKKRECERRKRIRQRLEKEKERASSGNPANVLLSMVDSCEVCKRLYVTVNLFWGTTLCDACYFNPDVIKHIMTERVELSGKSLEITPDNIVEEVLQAHMRSYASNQRFFDTSSTSSSSFTPAIIPPPKDVRKTLMTSSPRTLERMASSPTHILDEPVKLVSQSLSSSSSEGEEEEFIHEVDSEEEEKEQRPITQSPSPPHTPPSFHPSGYSQQQCSLSSQAFAHIFFNSTPTPFCNSDGSDDDFDLPMTPYNNNDPLDAPGTQQ